MADLGRRLRLWRERALLTQEQLAERAGVSVRSIRRYERGLSGGRAQSASIRLLADALGLSPEERAMLVADTREPGEPAATASAIRLRQLPAPPPLFTGRERELAELDRISDAGRLMIATIAGMAGVGKTALAVRAAHDVASRYPDEQIYLDLHGYTQGGRPVDPGEALDRVLRSLGVPAEQIPPDLDDRAALYRSRLAGRRALILLDNAATESQVAPLLPGTSGCLLLVTSRRRLPGLDDSHTVSLDLLPLPDAVALFAVAAGERRVRAEPAAPVRETVELCGRLPLAIRVAAARLRSHPSWTVSHLLERLQVRRRLLAELEAGERTVTAALDVSYEQLPAEQQRAYRLFGRHPGPELTAHAAAALLGSTVPAAEGLIDRLLDSHLLQEPTPWRFRFHDLVRAHSIARADADESEADVRAALTRLFDHYRHGAAIAMDVAYPYERERRPLVPPSGTPPPALDDPAAAIAWLDVELPTLLAVARHAADHGWPDHTTHLSGTLHRHLRGRAHYTTADTLHHLALAVARATGDGAAELLALTGLGHTQRQQGRTAQATDHYTQALAIAVASGDRPGEMWTLTGLGHAQRLQGRYEDAAESFSRARRIARDTGNRGAELDALTGLGWLHRQQGRGEQAIEDFSRARGIAHETGNRSGELDALTGLGWLHRQQGRGEQAGTSFEQALEIARAIGNRQGELNALNGLASTYRLEGRHRDAMTTLEHTLELSRAIGNRNLQFEALQGLGRLHFAAGDHDRALACHGAALELATGLRQPADQANAHDGLAHAHRALGRHADARHNWGLALDTLTGIGAEHTEDGEVTTAGLRALLAGPAPRAT
ncbi:ATP-binding protein [Pseudonocardia sp. DLS-67]